MTLRELFTSIADWWSRAIETVRLSIWTVHHVNPMDWPLWLFPVVGVLAYLALRLAIAIVTALFSKHADESGKHKLGWLILAEAFIEPLGFLAMYAAVIGLCMVAAGSLILLFTEGAIISRWWGLVGLLLVVAAFVAARWAFRAYDRRKGAAGGGSKPAE